MEMDVPISVAYKCYSDREAIPRWMPFISSVKVCKEMPFLSRILLAAHYVVQGYQSVALVQLKC